MAGPNGAPNLRSTEGPDNAITRRHFLGFLAASAGVIGVGLKTPAAASSIGAANAATLPVTRAWRPLAGEYSPSIKARATLLLETVGTWPTGSGGAMAARKRASALGFVPALVGSLSPLLGAGSSAVLQVRDAQYGGVLSNSASVLIVVDQWRSMPDGSVIAGGTTIDVRLVKASPHWRVIDAFPAKPGVPSSKLSPSALRVLSDSRIRLPYAAKSDVQAGGIHDSVLKFLIAIASERLVDVSILRSGHPIDVFGTSRPSDHPRGRAVDIWALDSKPLVLPANRALATSAMHLAVAHGAYNVGGPILLSGSEYFSDHTHQDHIHLGFNR